MLHPKKASLPKSLIESLETRLLLSVTPAVAPALAGQGLSAVYYANDDFTGASVTRTDPTVDFAWAGASPASGIGTSHFSARWTGNVTAASSGTFTFTVQASDGVRLWVNSTIIIDDWNAHASAVTDMGSASLIANQPATIRLEYFDGSDPASVHLSWSDPSTPMAIIPAANLAPTTDPLLAQIDATMGFARQQLTTTLTAMGGNTTAFPFYTNPNGTWATSNVGNWTAGFFGAEMWQMFSRTNDPAWQQSATTWTLPLAADQTFTDDLTFRIFNAYMPLYEATGNPAYKQVILNAVASKVSTWNSTVGAFSSVGVASHSGNPNANFGVLMDHMMDFSMVFWGAQQTGNQTWYNEALEHARTVAANFFRANGSVYQWGYFDKTTGQFESGENYQGYSDSSAWARAQAWAIYAFSVFYRETGAPDMLADAERVANYFVANLPADSIPYWDFNSPNIPSTFRDTSAAAIAASGLLQLGNIDPDSNAATYFNAGKSILTSLTSPAYLAEGTSSQGILLHGAWFVPAPISDGDASLVWGDYYLLEAMNEYLAMPGALPGTAPNPVTTAPTIALTGSATATANSSYTLTLGAVTDPGHTVTQYAVHWGDGQTTDYTNNGAKTHTYTTLGSKTISVDLTDSAGTHSGAGTLSVNVVVPHPTVAVTGKSTANAGGTYSLTLGPASDLNGTPSKYLVHWGDGSTSTLTTLGSFTHTFAKAGAVAISVDLTDKTGTFAASGNLAITVDPAPKIALAGSSIAAAKAVYSLTLGAVTDPGYSITQYTVHWGDGTTNTYTAGGVVTHAYAAVASATITVDLKDATGTYTNAGSLKVSVTSAPTSLFTTSADIGSPKLKGSASVSAGTYTVTGEGVDISKTSDQFHYYYKSATGKLTTIAKVTSVQNTNSWAKAGVMIRNGTAANAAFADLVVTPGGNLAFQWRSTAGGSVSQVNISGKLAPQWVKLVRTGNTFAAWYSTNGTTWTQIGKTQTIVMAAAVTTGLAVTSVNTSKTCTATFTNVSVS